MEGRDDCRKSGNVRTPTVKDMFEKKREYEKKVGDAAGWLIAGVFKQRGPTREKKGNARQGYQREW